MKEVHGMQISNDIFIIFYCFLFNKLAFYLQLFLSVSYISHFSAYSIFSLFQHINLFFHLFFSYLEYILLHYNYIQNP